MTLSLAINRTIGRGIHAAATVARTFKVALKPDLSEQLGKLVSDVHRGYHVWYYDTAVQDRVRYLGIPAFKSVADMWNYQEIIYGMPTNLVIEFGTSHGGSAYFFRNLLASFNPRYRVLTVDIDQTPVDQRVKDDPAIEMMQMSSTDPRVAERIRALRAEFPGPVFFILDSDHYWQHVYNELISIRPLTRPGDYVIVEDSNINGHPVLAQWGPGPFEGRQRYFQEHPDDYQYDEEREAKFGFTFATNGFLVRR